MSERYKTARQEKYLRKVYLCRLLVWVSYPVIVGGTLWDAHNDGVTVWTWFSVLISLWIWWMLDRTLLRILTKWEIAAEVKPLDPIGDPDLYEYVAAETVRRVSHVDLHHVRELRLWLRKHDVTQVAEEDRPHFVSQFIDAIGMVAAEMKRRTS